jgi:hypothetical protein
MKYNDDVVKHREDENEQNNQHNRIRHIRDISKKEKVFRGLKD